MNTQYSKRGCQREYMDVRERSKTGELTELIGKEHRIKNEVPQECSTNRTDEECVNLKHVKGRDAGTWRRVTLNFILRNCHTSLLADVVGARQTSVAGSYE
jgi:hypothetical protein